MTTEDSFELPPEIIGLEDISPHPNVLVFGKSGVGKTVLAGSDNKVLIINCEAEGTISAKRMGSTAKQWNVKTWDDFIKATDWVKSMSERCERAGRPFPFDWVAVDTITTLQNRILMRGVMDEALERNRNRDPDVPDKAEYLKNQLRLQRQIKDLNDLPVRMFYTAHVMQQTDPEGNEFLFPMIQGGKFIVAQAVLAMMTSFGYMYDKVREKDKKPVIDPATKNLVKDRFILWETYEDKQGKDRTGVLGSITKNLTLKDIRERMEAADKKAIESR